MSEQSDEHHSTTYPSIHLSGNVRAIIGNVYDSGGIGLFDAKRKHRKASLLRTFADESQETEELLVAISSELSVLLLRDFEDVKSSLYCFRKVENRLGKYAKRINIGRNIFQNTLLTLLSAHAGHEQALAMVSDQDHPTWLDERFTDYLRRLFGITIEAVYNVLELINADLDAIAIFSRKCFEWKDDSTQSSKTSTLQHMKSKLKTAISCTMRGDNIAEHLQSLRRNTEDFRTLLNQCIPQKQLSLTSESSHQTKMRIGRYKRVQEVATNLYHSLGLACADHPKHRGSLKLLTDCSRPSHVQFTLLLEQAGLFAPSLNIRPPLRLTIESQLNGTMTDTYSSTLANLHSFALGRKRLRDTDSGTDVEQKRCVKDTVPKRKRNVEFSEALCNTSPFQNTSMDELPNFCTHSNLCTHLGAILRKGYRNNTPLGYLDSHGCSKHLIYLTSRTQTVSLHPEPRESVHSFRALYNRTDHQLPKAEKTALAKQLALAILQYQATPWLNEAWNSDNILVEHGKAAPSTIQSPEGQHDVDFHAYLHVSIDGPDEYKDICYESRSRTLIRNWTLFNFGLMLLELAYSTPIRELRTLHDIDPAGNEYDTDYYTAMRMQERVSNEMGSVYAEIIRKCLQCDFSHGSDLGTTKLQEGFYENVIPKLEDLEAKFRAIGI